MIRIRQALSRWPASVPDVAPDARRVMQPDTTSGTRKVACATELTDRPSCGQVRVRSTRHASMIVVLAGLVFAGFTQASAAQAVYPTPDAAAAALQQAMATQDEDALKKVLGSDFRRFVPPTSEDDIYAFLGLCQATLDRRRR